MRHQPGLRINEFGKNHCRVMATTDWTCPFCNRDATITQNSKHIDVTYLDISNSDGLRAVVTSFRGLPKPEVQEVYA